MMELPRPGRRDVYKRQLAFRSDMETLRACIQIAVEAPAMGEAGGMIQEAAVRRPVLQLSLIHIFLLKMPGNADGLVDREV